MKFTKLVSILLVSAMLVSSLAACSGTKTPSGESGQNPSQSQEQGSDGVTPVVAVDPYAGKTHGEISESVYNNVLGDFNNFYTKAKTEAKSISERHALMAVSEAKLLGSGAFLPSTANGGNFAISRIVPYSANTTLWGNDSDRFYSYIIVDGDPLTPALRDEMKAKWGELRGTGTYLSWAKEFLTSKGMSINPNYNMLYDSNPATWDALATSMAVDTEAIVNTYDGLLEYNAENTQVPAIAESYEVSDDGLTYTFHIRKGVKWVDYQGRYIEDVTANSFVAGMHHMLDSDGGLEYLIDGVIVGVNGYINGDITDFSKVGVKATDEYTLVYTLEAPTSYFTTMFAYNIFAPMSEKFFLANGGAFGRDAFAAAKETDSYVYGTSSEKIAYCGPYLVTNETASNTIVFEANPEYWNKEAVNIQKLTWIYTSGDDKLESYNKMKANEIASAGLNTNATALAKEEGWFEKYAYVSSTDATSFPMFINLYRQAFANYNDPSVAVTTMTEEDITRNHIAIQNHNFRLAIVSSIDRAAYNAVSAGDELKYNALVNSYTPGNYVSLTEDVTIDINGKATKFAAGTFYGAIMQAQLDADGVPVKVWDPKGDGGAGSSSGFDGWYNVDRCRELLAKAVEELKAQGVEVSKDKPVILEMPYADAVPVFTDRANAIKQSIEASTEGLIKVVLIQTGGGDRKNYNAATYDPQSGDQINTNLNTNSGWGPDYGDPQTYLDTMLPEGAGYMTKCLGLY